MKYYDEEGNELKKPNLDDFYVTEEKRKTGEHEELMAGTEGRGASGKGLYRLVDEYETVGICHPKPTEPEEQNAEPTIEDRLSAIEQTLDILVMADLEA